jgi:hypothetical protein
MRFAMVELNFEENNSKLISTQLHLMKFQVQSLIIPEETPEHCEIATVEHAAQMRIAPICRVATFGN